MKKIKSLFQGLLVLLALFIGIWINQDNPLPVDVRLLGFEMPSLSLGIWLVLMLVAGIGLGMLASLPLIASRGRENRKLRQRAIKDVS